jgi:hypothetical protein
VNGPILAVVAALVSLPGAISPKPPRQLEVKDSAIIQAGERGSARAVCPIKWKAISGGYLFSTTYETNVTVLGNWPIGRIGWIVLAVNRGTGDARLHVTVNCER